METIEVDEAPILRPKSVDSIRDLAVQLETTDIEAAHALMAIAHAARPKGPFIEQKLRQYKQEMATIKNHISNLSELQRIGAAAIIPIGFRCFTAEYLRRRIGLSQNTHPFDVGFFPPASVASILKFPQISLCIQQRSSFDICQKYENHKHPTHGNGIKFCRSSKQEIDLEVSDKSKGEINQYLDASFGYYTLDNRHGYVLAHYNWHAFASEKYSRGCTDMSINLKNATETLNRRIDRMMKLCHAAEVVIFVYYNPNSYEYMQIDDEICDLCDLSEVKHAAKAVFNSKAHVLTDVELIESASFRENLANIAP
jgi:hypothetical protein